GSTLPLYGTMFCEHTAAVAVLLAAIDVALGGRRLVLAGALFGIATCFRTELYAFAPAMALVVVWRVGFAWRRWLACAAGGIVVAAAFLIVHRLATPAWHPTLTASADGEVMPLLRRFGHIIARELVLDWQYLVLATGLAGIARSLWRPRHAVTVVLALAWCV